MIGAMPAIAVRGKGKADGSIGFISRPHKLSLHFRPPLMHHQVTPTPSPVNSPHGAYCRESAHHRFARNFLSKRCIFQLSVLAPLVGVILLFIGLIQLTPGAEANPYGIPLILAGSAALLLGLLMIIMRIYFTWELNRLNARRDVPQIKVNEPSVTDPDVEKGISTTNPSVNTNANSNDVASANTNGNGKSSNGEKKPVNTKEKDQGQEETVRLLENTTTKITTTTKNSGESQDKMV